MKDFWGEEYTSLIQHEPSLKDFESANQLVDRQTTQQQQLEITQYFDELRSDALVGKEQIQ